MQFSAYLLFSAALLAVLTGILLLNILYKKKINKIKTENKQEQKENRKDFPARTSPSPLPQKNNYERKREPGLEESLFIKKRQAELSKT
jgi:hypothetical protein